MTGYGMGRRGWVAVCALTMQVGCASAEDAPPDGGHRVVGPGGEAEPWALVTARDLATGVATTVYSDATGHYALPDLPPGELHFEFRSALAEASPRTEVHVSVLGLARETRLGPSATHADPRASSFLAQLPESERKRELVIDCGGCHTFDSLRMRKDGHDRSAAEWTSALSLMLGSYGQGTGFPILSGRWDVPRDAAWLSGALAGADWPVDPAWDRSALARVGSAVLTEYPIPEPMDLPHDVVVHPSGEVLVTGMFTHLVWRLDPETGAFTTVPIPVPNANPRAIDVGPDGRWWVLLGAAMGVAAYDPTADEWESWQVGMYPHSIALDADGGAWFNGHFTVAPELVGRLDPTSGEVEQFEIESTPTPTESTIPYGLRVAHDGVVWGTQLRGNRLVRVDPATGQASTFEMPTPASGPRRLDVAPDGILWIPEFGANALARFDPATEVFEEFPFPAPDAAPYVVRVDQTRGTVWIGTGHADLVASFDPVSRAYTLYPLPTRGALVRHLDIDEATGDVWATYSASPGIGGKVLRLRPAG